MRPSSFDRSSVGPPRPTYGRAARSAPVVLAALAALAAPALAHHISLSTGTAVVEPQRVLVSLDVPAEDLAHYYAASRRSDETWSAEWLHQAAAQHGRFLAENFIIRDEDGQRLAGRLVAAGVALPSDAAVDFNRLRKLRARFELEYDLPAPPRWLTFQQTFNRGPVELPSQLALLVCRGGDVDEETVCLTSRGNVETLEFEWPEGDRATAADVPRWATGWMATTRGVDLPSWLTGPERFRGVGALIRRDGAGVTVEVYAPLALLETWTPATRRDADFLDADEQRAALAALRWSLGNALGVHAAGATLVADVREVAFLPPGAHLLGDEPAPPRLSAWTARVGARLRIAVERSDVPAELVWRLFNSAVHTANAVVIDGLTAREHVLSAYAPTLVIPPAAMPTGPGAIITMDARQGRSSAGE